MAISLRLKEECELIKNYAKLNNVTVSEFVRETVLERIEDEYDLDAYEKAMDDFKKNPKTYSIDEIKEDLGHRKDIYEIHK